MMMLNHNSLFYGQLSMDNLFHYIGFKFQKIMEYVKHILLDFVKMEQQNIPTVLHNGNYHLITQLAVSSDQNNNFNQFHEVNAKEIGIPIIVETKIILKKFKENGSLQEKNDQKRLVEFLQQSYKINTYRINNHIEQSYLSFLRVIQRQSCIDADNENTIDYKNMDNHNFQKMLNCFERKGFYYLYNKQKYVLAFIHSQLQYNFPYMTKFKHLLKRFIEIFQSKICSFSEWKCVYGDFQPLLKRQSAKIKQIKPLPIQPLFEDLLFHHFIQIYKTRNKGSGYYYENKLLSTFFNSIDLLYSKNPQWREVYFIVRVAMTTQDHCLVDLKSAIFDRNECTNNLIVDHRDYLCCTKNLRANKWVNMQCKFGLVQIIKDYNDGIEVKRKLCGLLNNTIGGTILFDYAEDYYTPKGYNMNKQQRQIFKKYITNLIGQLSPQPKGRQYKLDFIFIGNEINDIVVPRLNVKSSSSEHDAFSINDGLSRSCFLRRSTIFGEQIIEVKCQSLSSIKKTDKINDFVILNGEKICSSYDQKHICKNLGSLN